MHTFGIIWLLRCAYGTWVCTNGSVGKSQRFSTANRREPQDPLRKAPVHISTAHRPCSNDCSCHFPRALTETGKQLPMKSTEPNDLFENAPNHAWDLFRPTRTPSADSGSESSSIVPLINRCRRVFQLPPTPVSRHGTTETDAAVYYVRYWSLQVPGYGTGCWGRGGGAESGRGIMAEGIQAP